MAELHSLTEMAEKYAEQYEGVERVIAYTAYLDAAKAALEMVADDMMRRDRETAAKIIRNLLPKE